MDLAKILKAITGGKVRSAADLRADLAAIDVGALEKRVERLEGERRRLLLSGTDAEVVAIDQNITAANLEAERGAAAVEELTKQIAAAEQREDEAAIEAAVEQAEQVRTKLAADQAELDKAMTKAAALLGSIAGHSDTLRTLHKRIEKAGRPAGKVTDIAIIRRRAMERIK